MFVSAIILGFLGSLHCLGMCGPIAFMLPIDRQNHLKGGTQLLIYHSARLLAYGTIGLLFGLLGRGLYLFGMQQALSIFAGVLMILIVLVPALQLKNKKILQPFHRLVFKLNNSLGSSLKKKGPDAFATIGFLNGFLPCGLVYMAVLGAVAMATPWSGFGYMVLFGLGTVPLMTGAVYFSRLVKGPLRRKFSKAIPVFVVAIGILFILRGMGLGIPYISPKANHSQVSTTMECHHP